MNQHNNHNLGSRIQAKGMELQTLSKHQQHYSRSKRRVPAKIKLLVMLVILIAFFWWVNT